MLLERDYMKPQPKFDRKIIVLQQPRGFSSLTVNVLIVLIAAGIIGFVLSHLLR